MRLSVVICTKGRPESFKQAVKSLRRQSFKDWEMIVIRESPLAKARDLGWRRAKGEIVSWIDDDVVLDKDWARSLVKIFDDNQDVGGVSGPTIVPEKLLKNRAVFWWYKPKGWWKKRLARLWVKIMLDSRAFDVGKITKIGWWTPGSNFRSCLKLKGLVGVDYLEACNMSLRRKLVKQAGGFDLGFEGTAEWCEVDLAMRIKKEQGMRLVFGSQVKLEHQVSKAGAYADRRRMGERWRNYWRWRKKHL